VVALVRADQHLAGVASLADPAGLLRLLDRVLRPPATDPAGPAAAAGPTDADVPAVPADAGMPAVPAVPTGTEEADGLAVQAPKTTTGGDAP
jgi:hypothetical protein